MQATIKRYGFPLILIHWLLSLLIFVLLGLGWYIRYAPLAAPARSLLLDLHISLGLTGAILILVQILLRIVFKPRPRPDSVSWWSRLASMLYLPIYFLMILMLVSGYLQVIFSATSIEFWGVPFPVWSVADARLANLSWTIHGIVAFVLTGLLLVHLGLIALNTIKHPKAAAPLPTTAERLAKIGQAERASKIAQSLATDLRLFGWIEFWLQFALGFICGLLLLLATAGHTFSPSSTGVGDGMRWATYGFFLLCAALLLAFYYTRAGRKVVATPSLYFDGKIKVAFWFLRAGLFIGLVGIFISTAGVGLSISLLIAKIVSQPPGMAITEPNRIIRALDVFVLIVNLNLLMAHVIGTGITLWLGIRVAKARLEYMAMPKTG